MKPSAFAFAGSVLASLIIAGCGAEGAESSQDADQPEPLARRLPYRLLGIRLDVLGLGTSYTTASFAAGTASSSLGPYSNLEPADALVYRSGSHGHIVLFLGWNDDVYTSACVLEQASTASDMQVRARSTSSLHASGFRAIRSDNL